MACKSFAQTTWCRRARTVSVIILFSSTPTTSTECVICLATHIFFVGENWIDSGQDHIYKKTGWLRDIYRYPAIGWGLTRLNELVQCDRHLPVCPTSISDNYCHDNGDSAFAMMESFNADVSDNVFENNKYGIRLSVGTADNEFSNNLITGSTL